jgi:hypothetical protein
MGHFLHRGETKQITLYLDGKEYQAVIHNFDLDEKFNRKEILSNSRGWRYISINVENNK